MLSPYFLSLLSLPVVLLASERSNLNAIASLQRQHNYGRENEIDLRDDDYDFCISALLQETGKDEIFGPFYKFAIEFTPTVLPCSPCRYSSRPNPSWTKVSFENEVIRLEANEAQEISGADGSLRLTNPSPADFGTYYCTLNGFVAYIWSLEVEPFKYFDVLQARHWTPRTTNLPLMTLHTKWEPWSPCNRCNSVGKRHRSGYCFVEGNGPSAEVYRALQVYRRGLSCSLFLLLHPETDPDTIEALDMKPVLLIGYCKIPCDSFDTMVSRVVHPQIELVYANQLEMAAEVALEKAKERNRGKRGFVPGKPTFFEGLTLSILVALQLLILLHICRNRGKAK